jgi:Ca2+-binding EF-hand superfamily protein
MEQFRRLLREQYGNTLKGWLEGLDMDKNNRLDLEEFIERCEDLCYRGGNHEEAKKLFQWFMKDSGTPILSMEDIDPKAAECFERGDFDMITVKDTTTKKPHHEMSFEERQSEHGSVKWGRALALKQRAMIEDAKNEDKLMGAKSTQTFFNLLKRKFGNIPRAWRLGLDNDGNGRLSRNEFYQAARNMTYHGNLKKLWDDLNHDGGDFISLEELHPEAAVAIETFRNLLEEKHGNTLKGWVNGLDLDKNGRLDLGEFVERCEELGYPYEAKKLFWWLVDEPGKPYLTMGSIDEQAAEAFSRNDFEMISVGRSSGKKASEMTFEERQETNSAKWQKELARQATTSLADAAKAQREKDRGAATLGDFIALLNRKFGNTARAWRQHLDADGNGRLSRNEFYMGCRGLSYNGNVKKLWNELDDDGSGFISLAEIDPEAHYSQAIFRELLVSKFGNTLRAFRKMDRQRKNRIDMEEFFEHCERLGYPNDPLRLFQFLQNEEGKKYLSLEEIDPDAAECLARGDMNMTTKGSAPARGYDWQREIALEKRKALADHAAKRKELDCGASSVGGFLELLRRKFGNVPRAWRFHLDADGSGKLSRNEFFIAARGLAYAGNLKALWSDLDDDDGGMIALDELDPESAGGLSRFLHSLVGTFGSLKKAWKKGLDIDRSGKCEEEEFVERLEDLGLCRSHEERVQLHEWLRADKSARAIYLEDLEAFTTTFGL